MSAASGRATITHAAGLHARPAVRLTKLAKTFAAEVRLRGLPDGAPVDAKSIVKVMGLKLRAGTILAFVAEGDDAEAAVEALTALVERRFDEDG